MIDRECVCCKVVKPADQFSRRDINKDGLNKKCKACVSDYGRSRYKVMCDSGVKRNRKKPPPKPAWPMPTHTLTESLDNLRMRKWRGPVNHGCMVATL